MGLSNKYYEYILHNIFEKTMGNNISFNNKILIDEIEEKTSTHNIYIGSNLIANKIKTANGSNQSIEINPIGATSYVHTSTDIKTLKISSELFSPFTTGHCLFYDPIKINVAANELIIKPNSYTATITCNTPSSSKQHIIQNISDSDFLLTNGDQIIDGIKKFPNGLYVSPTSSLFHTYEEYIHNTYWIGVWQSPKICTLKITKIGNMVTVKQTNQAEGTQVLSAKCTTTSAIPARFTPSHIILSTVLIRNGSSSSILGIISVDYNGGFTISNSIFGNFSGSGEGKIWEWSMTYCLD